LRAALFQPATGFGIIAAMPIAPIFAALNMPPEQAGDGASGRVLTRLGEYAALIVGPLNMRPTAAALAAADAGRVEARISTPGRHVLLVIAAEGDLAGEVFFLRSLALKHLPAPRLIAHDLTCGVTPFTWAVLSHVAGAPLAEVADAALVRLAARQVGRTLRRAHQIPAPGFGWPQTTGRWPARGWREALGAWMARRDARPRALEVLGEERAAALWAATIEHAGLACEAPHVLHGAVAPERALVTGADHSIQLEALVRSGEIVAGDPLFDLAYGLLPHRPEPFRRGLLEGYTASGPLAPEQERRLARLRLLVAAVDTLARGEPEGLAALPGVVDEGLRTLKDEG
jgi:aminoglycoside phosphotransferase (APT) family kinase protein